MTKAIANRAEEAEPTGFSGATARPLDGWLQHAMADLAVRGADDAAPIDLTQSLAAMAALLQEAIRPNEGTRMLPPALAGDTRTNDAPAPGDANSGALVPARATGERRVDIPKAADRAPAVWRAGGDQSLERVLDHAGRRRASLESTPEGRSLAAEIATFAGRPLDIEKGFAALDALEQSIARLSEQMEQARRTGPDAAEAARNAQRGFESHERRMAREVSDLRTARDESDSRVFLALNAMQENVDKVADRLTAIETDLAAVLPPRAGPRSDKFGAKASGAAVRPGVAGDPALNQPDATARTTAATIDDLLIEPGAGFAPGLAQPRLAPSRAADLALTENGREPAAADGRASVASPHSYRQSIMLAFAMLSFVLGAYVLARNCSLNGFDPPRLLKSIGIGALGAEAEQKTVTAGEASVRVFTAELVGRREMRIVADLLDPSAFQSARGFPVRNAGLTAHAIAGSDPILLGKITLDAPEPAQAPAAPEPASAPLRAD